MVRAKSNRGGVRQGIAGKKYPNRTDMAGGPRKPASVKLPNGMPYGEKSALQKAEVNTPQLAQQMPTPPSGTAPTSGPPQVSSPGPQIPAPSPGLPPPLPTDPTNRPTEPLTSGIDSGPGPGASSLGLPQTNDLSPLTPYLPALEIMSTLPNATQTTKNFVRKLRSSVPVPFPQGVQ